MLIKRLEPTCCLDVTCFWTGWLWHGPTFSSGKSSLHPCCVHGLCEVVYLAMLLTSKANSLLFLLWISLLLLPSCWGKPQQFLPWPSERWGSALVLGGSSWGHGERRGIIRVFLNEFLGLCLSCLIRGVSKSITGKFSKAVVHMCLGKINSAK